LTAGDDAEAAVMARLIVIKISFNSWFPFKTVKNTSILMEEGVQQLFHSSIIKTIFARP